INWPKSISAAINGVQSPGTSSDDETTTGDLAAVMPLENGSWQLGYLSVGQLDIVLDFLARRNNSKLLSNPRLTTIEDETASIEVETVIPIQTINRFSEGAVIQDIVTFQDERVGISLKVTPRVNDDSTITLKVNPIVSEIIGYSGPADNQKPITSERSVITNVTVKSNETLVLGGLIKESSINTEESVFFLGSIPIIGALFKHNTKEVTTTDLMILITPRIMD
ncbi:MAG: type II and III secretion system protein, partial [candidate division Zixibacteria bacterium]|nr:type II and III secretion system protein [candidate division Zixibacteria bacterium]